MAGALDGLLVVALEQAVAAPYCSSRLADASARVIKIERAEGDFARRYDHVVQGESAYFVWLNRGKESVVLDIKDSRDKALLHRLIARADVFIQNLAPGAAARADVGSTDLRARYRRLITCDISGYGEDNSYSAMPAYDLLVQAETGLCSVTGDTDHAGRVGVSVCDIAAGMYAHQAILEALIQRGTTGDGQAIKVSLFDGMADWMTVPLLHFDYGGAAPRRAGLRHPSIAPYGVFHSRDGDGLLVSIQNEREWGRFAAHIMDHPEWADNGPYVDNVKRVAHRADLDAAIQAVFAAHATAEICEKLITARIAFGRLNGIDGLSAHPALRRVRIDTPGGPVDIPAPPPVGTARSNSPGPVPALGAHTKSIRDEFGDQA